MDDIIYKQQFVDKNLLQDIKQFYSRINDSFSNGPKSYPTEDGGTMMMGCWDRPLRLEMQDNPLHTVIADLKSLLGDFVIHTSSIRYLAFPFVPHSDIRSSEWIIEHREKYQPGYTILIPLDWKPGYTPGTAFFDSPPLDGQDLYIEHQDILPTLTHPKTAKNYGVKKIVEWQYHGDLIAWKNYMWHSSLADKSFKYSNKEHCKEFISIETFLPR